jgi:antirestriction protein ArdC
MWTALLPKLRLALFDAPKEKFMREGATSTEKQDVYSRITSQIVTAIENGVGTWKMPWHTSGRDAFSPINVSTRKPYRGINTLCLWAAGEAKKYDRGEWGTYQQFQEHGAQVRKGEKATTVIYWKFAHDTTEAQDGEENTATAARLLFVKGYSVFNGAQVDGHTPKPEPTMPIIDRIARADAFFQSVGADVRHGGDRAYYSTGSDHIQMPEFDRFDENAGYYSTLAHEHCHWTATKERCDRQLGKRFGDNQYAAEELVAELGAAFVCGHLGLASEPRPDHAEYIGSWLNVLKADKRVIFTAASKAQQAADCLIERGESKPESGVVNSTAGVFAGCA